MHSTPWKIRIKLLKLHINPLLNRLGFGICFLSGPGKRSFFYGRVLTYLEALRLKNLVLLCGHLRFLIILVFHKVIEFIKPSTNYLLQRLGRSATSMLHTMGPRWSFKHSIRCIRRLRGFRCVLLVVVVSMFFLVYLHVGVGHALRWHNPKFWLRQDTKAKV